MKRLLIGVAAVAAMTFGSSAMAQDAERVLEHTGPAVAPGASGQTGGWGTTVGGVGIGASGMPTLADVHGPNAGIPSRDELGVIADYQGGGAGMSVAPNSTGAVANKLGIAGTGANGANPAYRSTP